MSWSLAADPLRTPRAAAALDLPIVVVTTMTSSAEHLATSWPRKHFMFPDRTHSYHPQNPSYLMFCSRQLPSSEIQRATSSAENKVLVLWENIKYLELYIHTMITSYKLFELSNTQPMWLMNAIDNTSGAEMLDNGWIKLQVSRYQRPEQGGSLSPSTGVYFSPEHDSKTGVKHYKDGTSWGGSEYIHGTLICKRPYIIKAKIGGVGAEIAYKLLVGYNEYYEMMYDIASLPAFSPTLDSIKEILTTYKGDVTMANYILKYYKADTPLVIGLREHIVAHMLRYKGYDSILSWEKRNGWRFVEVFYVDQNRYPRENGFLIE